MGDTGGPLYLKEETFYKIRVRWMSSIDSVKVKTLDLKPVGNKGDMEIDIELEFENLPLSVKAQACTGFIGCVTAMDNTDACCGSGVTLTTKMTLDCSPNTPHLQNPKVTELSLSPIKVDISFAGIHITSKDVTSDAEK